MKVAGLGIISLRKPQALWASGVYGTLKLEHPSFEETADTCKAEKQNHKLRRLFPLSPKPERLKPHSRGPQQL